MKRILGLDLGTNSIGWAVVNVNDEGQPYSIENADSRIIPMDSGTIDNFEQGKPASSKTADRRAKRSMRRVRERFLLRRQRLLRVLDHMGFLPPHFSNSLDRYGNIVADTEPKIAWDKNSEGKNEFLFMDSFHEMAAEFSKAQPSIADGNKLIPHDWTLYYLRKKALSSEISKQELAWVLLSFIQKRGYNPVVGIDDNPEEEKKPTKNEYFHKGEIVKITNTGKTDKKNIVFVVELADGLKGKIMKKEAPDLVGLTKDIIVTEKLKDGKVKFDDELGMPDISFRIPTEVDWENEWGLVKKRTENEVEKSQKTLGAYIFDSLLANPSQKIIGKLVRTVDRAFYHDELHAILKSQSRFHSELQNAQLYQECIGLLYPVNEMYRKSISNRDFEYLIADDIILYQRPLKTKKSLIANCQYESMKATDGKTYGLKCIAKSHPLFEEFRLWQWISNLRIYKREDLVNGKIVVDNNVTAELLPDINTRVALFDWLSGKVDIEMNALLSFPGFGLKAPKKMKLKDIYRWNYVEDKTYPCCKTRAKINAYLKKAGAEAVDGVLLENLWQILYSSSTKAELGKALATFCAKHFPSLDAQEFSGIMSRIPAFEKDYGSYSAKAIKKLLPLMRMGKYWSADAIDGNTKDRIEKIINGEADDTIKNRVRELAISLSDITAFQGLPLWLACYVVYDRHSEASDLSQWTTPDDITHFLQQFKTQSLHNPIVEQVVLESLRVVRDIWSTYGKPNEIHIEIGRDLKKNSKEREKLSKRNVENETAIRRAKAMILELSGSEVMRRGDFGKEDYEQAVSGTEAAAAKDLSAVLEKYEQRDCSSLLSFNNIFKYRCWQEQGYRSPYTGEVIPLSELFTPAYEIEHVIPRSRFYDNSYSNKVVCESCVNKLKGAQLGFEFIKNCHGSKVQDGGKTVEVLSVEAYQEFVQSHYSNQRLKMKKLLLEEIPEQFDARQLNDSRYISKLMAGLLSNIVRTKGEEGVNSKNVIMVTGQITDALKLDWGLKDVWDRLLLPRFKRMEEVDPSNEYVKKSAEGHDVPNVPDHMKVEKKRLDHRHHAMDAIAIACCTRNHVSYINNEAASDSGQSKRYDLQQLLCEKRGGSRVFVKPWGTFTQDVMQTLQNAVVSFKQTNRILNRTSNRFLRYVEMPDGSKKKEAVVQKKGDRMAIRRPLHAESVFGHVNLRQTKSVNLSVALQRPNDIVDKDIRKAIVGLLAEGKDAKQIKKFFLSDKELWGDFNEKAIAISCFTDEEADKCYAMRYPISQDFTAKKIEKEVYDFNVKQILLNHLQNCNGSAEEAFSPEGIEKMNRNIVELNHGVPHKPIYRVRCVTPSAERFAVGQRGNKGKKFVIGAKGKNVFFAVYADEEGKRSYATVALNDVIKRLKQGENPVPGEQNGAKLLFFLAVNDLVYLPRKEEEAGKIDLQKIDKSRIFKFVSSGGRNAFFVPAAVAKSIVDRMEYTGQNKFQSIFGKTIQSTCVPIKVDRLGNIAL